MHRINPMFSNHEKIAFPIHFMPGILRLFVICAPSLLCCTGEKIQDPAAVSLHSCFLLLVGVNKSEA